MDEVGQASERIGAGQWIGEISTLGGPHRLPIVGPPVGGIEPRDQVVDNATTIRPGMTMAQIERAAIENALRETRGNRRKAAELLAIGERTLYRKIREYELVGVVGGEDDLADEPDE
ncbi:MAG: hypothetical protein H7066_01895 [Cytophagaceae bacterium]|nr:hypothetical protein [Gemmatimonadaceae bacterium]